MYACVKMKHSTSHMPSKRCRKNCKSSLRRNSKTSDSHRKMFAQLTAEEWEKKMRSLFLQQMGRNHCLSGISPPNPR